MTLTPARTVTPLYDRALEGMLDGEVECTVVDCGTLATHLLIVPCRHNRPKCEPHAARWIERMSNPIYYVNCVHCGDRNPIATVTIRPI